MPAMYDCFGWDNMQSIGDDKQPRLVLASSSPRRRELLHTLGVEFDIEVSDVDESFEPSLHPSEVVRQLAERKAKTVANRLHARQFDPLKGTTAPSLFSGRNPQQTLVLAADTIVVLDGTILGKPCDRGHAIEMLSKLQGRTHEVFTGVCLCQLPSGAMESGTERTLVTMGQLDRREIEDYVDSGHPMDKAGSYGIQGAGAVLVERVEGDYYTVVGLPVRRIALMLKKHGFVLFNRPPRITEEPT